MTIRFGVSPIAWTNDDMPELGGDTAVETILADAEAIGFAGVELGGKFPRRAGELAPLLATHRLALIGGWYSTSLLTRSAEQEIAALQPHLELLVAMGSPVFIAAETSNAIHGDRARPLAGTPRLSAVEWPRFGARLNALAAGQPPPQPDEDPDVHAAIEAAIATAPMVEGARLGPPVSPDADLHVQLLIAPGGEQAVQHAAEQIAAALASRLRRGIEFSAAAAGAS